MEKQDLENHVDVPESEYEYEAYLDVIKLRLPILIGNISPAPKILLFFQRNMPTSCVLDITIRVLSKFAFISFIF